MEVEDMKNTFITSEEARKFYKEKFERLFSNFAYIPQPDEKIVQCRETFPAYWFISNYGYLFSVFWKELKVLKPYYTRVGYTNKSGDRYQKKWYYTYIDDSGKRNQITVHRLVAIHFLKNNFNMDNFVDDTEDVHHIIPRGSFDQNEWKKCNRVSNLQILPVEIHKAVTKQSKKITSEWFNEKVLEVKNDPNRRTIIINNTDFMSMMQRDLEQAQRNDGECPVYYHTETNEHGAIPLKNVDFLKPDSDSKSV